MQSVKVCYTIKAMCLKQSAFTVTASVCIASFITLVLFCITEKIPELQNCQACHPVSAKDHMQNKMSSNPQIEWFINKMINTATFQNTEAKRFLHTTTQ